MYIDVCIGVSEFQLNELAAQFHSKLRQAVFSGEFKRVGPDQDIDVQYDIDQPPLFHLGDRIDHATAVQSLMSGMPKAGLAGLLGANEGEFNPEKLMTELLKDLPSFILEFPSIVINLISGSDKVKVALSGTVQAGVDSVGGRLVFSVMSTRLSDGVTPAQKWVIAFLEPEVQKAVRTLLDGLSITVPTVPGVNLSPFSVGIVHGTLLAVAVMNGPQPPRPQNPFPGFGPPFFVSLSSDLLQTAADLALANGKTLNGGDSSGSRPWAEVHYNYSFTAVRPRLRLEGEQLAAEFQISGHAGAGAVVVTVNIGIGVDIHAPMPPTVIFDLRSEGSKIKLVSVDVRDFFLIVQLSGPLRDLVGWMVNWLLTSIANALKPQLVGYLRGVEFISLDLPTTSQDIAGTRITLTPSVRGKHSEGPFYVLDGKLTIT